MLKDFDLPVAVPTTAVSVDDLRAEVRKKQFRVWEFNYGPDLLVDFSKPLNVRLYKRSTTIKVPWSFPFGYFGYSMEPIDLWCVEVRNENHEQTFEYNAKGSSACAVTLANEVEEAKEKYERAVTALKQAQES